MNPWRQKKCEIVWRDTSSVRCAEVGDGWDFKGVCGTEVGDGWNSWQTSIEKEEHGGRDDEEDCGEKGKMYNNIK